jgi:hypothetical protein
MYKILLHENRILRLQIDELKSKLSHYGYVFQPDNANLRDANLQPEPITEPVPESIDTRSVIDANLRTVHIPESITEPIPESITEPIPEPIDTRSEINANLRNTRSEIDTNLHTESIDARSQDISCTQIEMKVKSKCIKCGYNKFKPNCMLCKNNI